MNAPQVSREISRLDELVRLCREAQSLAVRPRDRRRLLVLLAGIEQRVRGLQQRMVEAVLSEMLWRHLGHAGDTYSGNLARELLVELQTRNTGV